MLCFLNLRYDFEKNVSYNAKHSLRRCCLVILAITTYICTHTHTYVSETSLDYLSSVDCIFNEVQSRKATTTTTTELIYICLKRGNFSVNTLH